MTNNNERLHALDAVRATALLLGIVLHATMSFFLPIPAVDSSQSTTLGVLFFVIHIFRMTAFYLIAGFFARMMLERKGLSAFVKDRTRRIVAPMVGGWIVLAPMLIAIIVWGLTRSFPDGPPEGATEPLAQAFPLMHLWFLYYLCIFYVLALLLRDLFVRALDRSGVLRRFVDALVAAVVRSSFAPAVLALPLCLVLYFDASWIVWAGIPTPDQGFTPKIPALIGFGTAFGLGWLVHRQIDLLQEWRKRWAAYLIVASGLTVAALAIVGPTLNVTNPAALTVVPGPEWMRIVYAACYTVAIWYWTFGIVGCALTFRSRASATWRYLADSSYWLYLAHMPIVMFLQVVMARLPLHWSIKFPAILAISIAALLLSYRYWVRYTWLGAILNGRRQRPVIGGQSSGVAKASQV